MKHGAETGVLAKSPETRPPIIVEGADTMPLLQEFKTFLEAQWGTLNDLCRDMQRRAGVEKPKDIPRTVVLQDMDENDKGEYKEDEPDKVFFNRKYIEKMIGQKEFREAAHQYYRLLRELGDAEPSLILINPITKLFKTFIHEVLHATSVQKRTTLSEGGKRFLRDVGYHRTEWNDEKFVESQGFYLNEAVTEHLSQAVFDEFLRRSGTAFELGFRDTISLSDHLDLRKSAYVEARKQIFKFVALAAEELDVTADAVWQALIRQYFSGEIAYGDFALALQSLSGYPKDYFPSADEQQNLPEGERRRVWLNFLNHTLFKSLELMGCEFDNDVELTHRIIARRALRLHQ